MPREKSEVESPIVFRPGADIRRLVMDFASSNDLSLHAAFRNLASLAIIGLDVRHHAPMFRLSTGLGGEHAFGRACSYVLTALQGFELAHDGQSLTEPERSRVVSIIISQHLARLFPKDQPPVSSRHTKNDDGDAGPAQPTFGQPAKRRLRSKKEDLKQRDGK
jgi:hypothetical protein